MSREGSRLGRLSILAPAALSACMDASVLAVPAAGAIVSTVLKELSKAFMLKKWFHGVLSAKETENLMMEKGRNGSFLVRESRTHPGELVLSVRVQGRVSHVMIRKQDDKYHVGNGEEFEDLVGLIEHFRQYPMVENSGAVLRLLQPLSGTAVARPRAAIDVVDSPHETENYGEVEEGREVEDEFQSLQLMDSLSEFTTCEAERPNNAAKNRYRNILPYDQTRVVLRGECPSGDYINASYIKPESLWDYCSSVESSNESLHSFKSLSPKIKRKSPVPLVSKSLSDDALREVKRCIKLDKINRNYTKTSVMNDKIYVATQGCLSNTKRDFWHMVWQEDIRVIVMITNEVEKGKRKCEKYWPAPGQEEVSDNLTIKGISERVLDEYCIRELALSDHNKTRTVFQYHYMGWPDHGAPPTTEGVLAFIEDINNKTSQIMYSKNRPEKKVVCVHCSAGVGRTGTFIVLDMILDKIKVLGGRRTSAVDVGSTVRLVRAQRSGMVQSRAQYRFIHRTLKDHLRARIRSNTTQGMYSPPES